MTMFSKLNMAKLGRRVISKNNTSKTIYTRTIGQIVALLYDTHCC